METTSERHVDSAVPRKVNQRSRNAICTVTNPPVKSRRFQGNVLQLHLLVQGHPLLLLVEVLIQGHQTAAQTWLQRDSLEVHVLNNLHRPLPAVAACTHSSTKAESTFGLISFQRPSK